MAILPRLTPPPRTTRRAALALVVATGGCGSDPEVVFVGTAHPPFEAVCTPMVEVRDLDPAGGGKIFASLVTDPTSYVQGLTRRVCPLLYRKPQEVPNVPKITIAVENVLFPFSAVTDDLTTTVSSSFLQGYAKTHSLGETGHELTGVLVHHFSHIYQHVDGAPQTVLQGVNDFVRYRTGYLPLSRRRKGGHWDDGSHTTGFFYDYLDERFPDFVYRFNAGIARGYDVTLFWAITGEDVFSLWDEYQASL